MPLEVPNEWPSVVNVLRRGGKFSLSAVWTGEPPSRMGCAPDERQYAALDAIQTKATEEVRERVGTEEAQRVAIDAFHASAGDKGWEWDTPAHVIAALQAALDHALPSKGTEGEADETPAWSERNHTAEQAGALMGRRPDCLPSKGEPNGPPTDLLAYIDSRLASLRAALPPTPDISGYSARDLGRHDQIYDELRVLGEIRTRVAASLPSKGEARDGFTVTIDRPDLPRLASLLEGENSGPGDPAFHFAKQLRRAINTRSTRGEERDEVSERPETFEELIAAVDAGGLTRKGLVRLLMAYKRVNERMAARLEDLEDTCPHRDMTLTGDGDMRCDRCGFTEPDPFHHRNRAALPTTPKEER